MNMRRTDRKQVVHDMRYQINKLLQSSGGTLYLFFYLINCISRDFSYSFIICKGDCDHWFMSKLNKYTRNTLTIIIVSSTS